MPSSPHRRPGRRAISDAPLDNAPDNAEILDALRGAGGIISDAAKALHISRDALGELLRADAGLREELHSIRETNLDLAKSQLLKAIKAGDAASARFFLKTVGASRGYAERPGAAAPPPPRPLYDEQEMRRRLRGLSTDELLELQTAVAAKEARSRAELAAIDFDADED